MWLPVECKNKKTDPLLWYRYRPHRHVLNASLVFYPYRYVQTKIMIRGDYLYCSGSCPCCNKKTSIKTDSIGLIMQWINKPPGPHYVSGHAVNVGCYTPILEELLQVGHVVDALNNSSVWTPSVIQSICKTHVRVRHIGDGVVSTIHKSSPRLAAFGKHTNPWQTKSGSCATSRWLTETTWDKTGMPVLLNEEVHESGYCKYTIVE